MKRNFLSAAILICCICLLLAFASICEATPRNRFSYSFSNVGNALTVKIHFSQESFDGMDATAYQPRVLELWPQWQNAYLDLVSIQPGQAAIDAAKELTQNVRITPENADWSEARAVIMSPTNTNRVAPGEVLILNFNILDHCPSALQWRASKTAVAPVEAQEYLTLENGQFPMIEKGDVNGDAKIDLADAMIALQIAMGSASKPVNMNADVNADGRIGLAEAVYILQWISGLRIPAPAEISRITELSSRSENIVAASGGKVAFDAFTADFPESALLGDAVIKASKVTVLNSRQDPSLTDLTNAYVLSTTSSSIPLELTKSAGIAFNINPSGFDAASIRLVFWNGYQWQEVPAEYSSDGRVVSSTMETILPFGTRIYMGEPAKKSVVRPGVRRGRETVTEFAALKVVGVLAAAAPAAAGDAAPRSVAAVAGRAIYFKSKNFTVKYTRAEDSALAEAVSGYLENAHDTIVVQMGFKKPAKTVQPGYGETWPVSFTDLGDAYGRADDANYIEIQEGSVPDDDLAHTCHHEFTHLVQYKTLRDARNNTTDGLSWFDETMADAIGFYAQKGLGVIYAAANAEMGHFEERLDSDEYTIPDNEDYEYLHFPFISYLLAHYGHVKFRGFFETFYAYFPGKSAINMTSIDTAANKALGKDISGRGGIYWDFYRDYFISGSVFNKDKFKNLPGRPSGAPFEISQDNAEEQGAAIVTFPGAAYQNDFSILRLSGRVLILRFSGKSDEPLNLSVNVGSSPGPAGGRIQLVAFRRSEGILQPVGAPEDVNDGATRQINYQNFGKDIHEIYVVMANTHALADGYRVTVGAIAAAP
jgi:hypothetical protein